jgi:hypothetical protein
MHAVEISRNRLKSVETKPIFGITPTYKLHQFKNSINEIERLA